MQAQFQLQPEKVSAVTECSVQARMSKTPIRMPSQNACVDSR
jgi:hypothetical protein